jgi:serpin B
MRNLLLLSSSVSLALALAACSGASSPTSPPGTVTVDGQPVSMAKSISPRIPIHKVPSSALADAVAANNAFAVDLYAHVRDGSSNANLLTSPISASLALTMTYAGALGTTATQMATALHYGQAGDTIFEGQNALSQALASRGAAALAADQEIAKGGMEPAPSPENYQLQVVNSVWGQSTYTWNSPFLNILAEDYGTGVYLQDFVTNYNSARLLINDWVSGETNDKITDLLPPGTLNDDTRMVLVNAIHLKLPWANTFDTSATAPASFNLIGGTSVSTPFMNQTTTLPYVDDGNAQVVGLPLSNNQLAVVIALPHKDLASYEASLTDGSAALKYPTGSAYVQLSLPKVSFTSPSFSLASALVSMGMPEAFNPKLANFHGLCSQPPDGDNLYISDVIQKAMIAMQETGVEAAAATAVVVAGASIATQPPPVVPMNVNHPYVVSIVDIPTGAVLFLGHIVNPS